jgi:hypothetical protein
MLRRGVRAWRNLRARVRRNFSPAYVSIVWVGVARRPAELASLDRGESAPVSGDVLVAIRL